MNTAAAAAAVSAADPDGLFHDGYPTTAEIQQAVRAAYIQGREDVLKALTTEHASYHETPDGDILVCYSAE